MERLVIELKGREKSLKTFKKKMHSHREHEFSEWFLLKYSLNPIKSIPLRLEDRAFFFFLKYLLSCFWNVQPDQTVGLVGDTVWAELLGCEQIPREGPDACSLLPLGPGRSRIPTVNVVV